MKEQIAAKGWKRPPGGADSFAQLFANYSRKGVRFLADVSEAVDGQTFC